LTKVPDTLDLTPYRDFHDAKEIKKMAAGAMHCPDIEPKHKIYIAGLAITN